ncbi:hypothetical protein MMSR116_29360 [Methylobacterium mesophilicum SR1.6/6]|uniref:Uncharacterized protein n=1 Tax=Methylobacterium mesophilicum SR1.6/6 TaxID=908290 RepID=A0A6B9FZH7_9HYPH|nr:hypothetical protein [Methylobacterium mesophilicum]QGY05545.1 hypothetical protein MMSR116_29360 [Methylobacterium mesophilicum SR1.6/6]
MLTTNFARPKPPHLPRGTRIGRPRADGSLILGTILSPAFGEGFYCAELRGEAGPEIVCLHVGEVLVDPVFADLRTAAVALRDLDERAAPAIRPRRVVGAF